MASSTSTAATQRMRETIRVAFYYNDMSKKEKGVVGWFKNGMDFWHTEIAFPMSMYRDESGGATDASRSFAYGVFAQHVDDIRGAQLVHRDANSMTFSIFQNKAGASSVPAQRLIVSASKGWKEKSVGSSVGDLATRRPEESRPVQVFQSRGKVDVAWAVNDRAANRFSRSGQAWAKLTISHPKRMVKLELPGIVFGKPREFSNPAYTWVHLSVPYENAVLAANFADAQVGKPHDPRGIYWAMVWPRRIDYKSYYCVNLVAAVLQQAGLIQGINPSYLLPDDLFHLLKDHPDRITSANPYVTAQAWKSVQAPRVYSSMRQIAGPHSASSAVPMYDHLSCPPPSTHTAARIAYENRRRGSSRKQTRAPYRFVET